MTKSLNILDQSFKYTHSSKTDISKTFAKARKEIRGGQDKNKPLVEPNLSPNGFVLSEEWFQVED
jgi:hypothetical protein